MPDLPLGAILADLPQNPKISKADVRAQEEHRYRHDLVEYIMQIPMSELTTRYRPILCVRNSIRGCYNPKCRIENSQIITPVKRGPIKGARHTLRKRERRCVFCGNLGCTVEHVWPLHYGGCNHHHNLVISCAKCNTLKGNRIFDGPEFNTSGVMIFDWLTELHPELIESRFNQPVNFIIT